MIQSLIEIETAMIRIKIIFGIKLIHFQIGSFLSEHKRISLRFYKFYKGKMLGFYDHK